MRVFDKTCGRFRLTVSEPWPMWVKLEVDGEPCDLSHMQSTELHDLRYLVDRAIIHAEARDATP